MPHRLSSASPQGLLPAASRNAIPLWRANVRRTIRHIGAGLRGWWAHLRLDERSRYMARSVDMVDLEQRIGRWDAEQTLYAWMTLRAVRSE